MYLISLKIVAALSIFILTLVFGLLPAKIAKTKSHLLFLGDAFSSGVFLSAALLHLMPDAAQNFSTAFGEISYPFANLLCLTTFITLIIMERGVCTCGKHYILLISLLIIHSLIEGAAIGTSINLTETSLLFIAVFAHKGSESFALAANLQRYNLTSFNIRKIMIFFSLITPIGIGIASLVMYMLNSSSGSTITGVLNSITAGTFLYMGTEHLMKGEKACKMEIISIVMGVLLMALVAIWV